MSFTGWGALVAAALALGIVNAVIRPILLFLTFPITLLTLGLFILVVNGISLALVAWLVPGFHVAGLAAAVLGALVVSVTGWFASSFVGHSGRIERFRHIEVSADLTKVIQIRDDVFLACTDDLDPSPSGHGGRSI